MDELAKQLTITISFGGKPSLDGGAYPVDGGYMTKTEAGYRKGMSNERCKSCKYFSPAPAESSKSTGSCERVSGTISPTYTCDYYASASADSESTSGDSGTGASSTNLNSNSRATG